MKTRTLGPGGPVVSALGLGCMGMSDFYADRDDARSVETLHRALELGVTLFDTADMYGPHTQRGTGRPRARRAPRRRLPGDQVRHRPRPRRRIAARDRRQPRLCQGRLRGLARRLGTDRIDLYYQHRVDPKTPIEETVGAMAELVEEGKVRHLGLSEAGAETIRRAHAVHPITAVQWEYSLWTRDVEEEVKPVVEELGIGLVPYSPLGRGFLSGKIRSLDDLESGDYRRKSPRFEGDNLERNLELVGVVEEIAAERGATPAQVALAWVLSRGEHLVPIPGTKRVPTWRRTSGRSRSSSPPMTRTARGGPAEPVGRALRRVRHADGQPLSRPRVRPWPSASCPRPTPSGARRTRWASQNTDLGKQLEATRLGARLWRLAPGQASTRHRHIEQEELYVLLEGRGRVRVDDELLTLERRSTRCWSSPTAPGRSSTTPMASSSGSSPAPRRSRPTRWR